MPTYEYSCEQGHNFEVEQRMTDDALDSCEQCGAPAQRVFHSPAAHTGAAGILARNLSEKPDSDTDSGQGESSWLDSYAETRDPPSRRRYGRKS
ncbi:MAG: zinc ribbon domain-containing protein [Actinomycetota bacterium]|nr:zinc ribbon domain-containing protein [Actinomycetota bacterium]